MYSVQIDGIALTLETAPTLFSPRGLDTGTRAMLSTLQLEPNDKVLDLGCGCGVVGIWAARRIGPERVTLSDCDPLAVRIARENALRNGVAGLRVVESDGFAQLDDTGYTLILSNPPYHTDFHVAKQFIEKGFNRLVLGGRMVMVTKRLDWYRNKLTSVFGGVRVQELEGYYLFCAEKRRTQYAGVQPPKKKKRNAPE